MNTKELDKLHNEERRIVDLDHMGNKTRDPISQSSPRDGFNQTGDPLENSLPSRPDGDPKNLLDRVITTRFVQSAKSNADGSLPLSESTREKGDPEKAKFIRIFQGNFGANLWIGLKPTRVHQLWTSGKISERSLLCVL